MSNTCVTTCDRCGLREEHHFSVKPRTRTASIIMDSPIGGTCGRKLFEFGDDLCPDCVNSLAALIVDATVEWLKK